MPDIKAASATNRRLDTIGSSRRRPAAESAYAHSMLTEPFAQAGEGRGELSAELQRGLEPGIACCHSGVDHANRQGSGRHARTPQEGIRTETGPTRRSTMVKSISQVWRIWRGLPTTSDLQEKILSRFHSRWHEGKVGPSSVTQRRAQSDPPRRSLKTPLSGRNAGCLQRTETEKSIRPHRSETDVSPDRLCTPFATCLSRIRPRPAGHLFLGMGFHSGRHRDTWR